MSELDIGILALQGDVAENFMSTMMAMNELGIDGSVSQVKTPDQISAVDGLIIPGGESTMMGQLSLTNGAMNSLKEKIESGMPVLGICAGMILLSSTISDGRSDQIPLGAIDIDVRRNGYGRQIDSFETELEIDGLDGPFHGVFIRAPVVERVGEAVDVLAAVDRQPVLCRQGSVLVAAFHPELVDDDRIHRVFMDKAFACA